MRILIIAQYFYPEDFRINEIAKRLIKEGNVVEIVTGLPNYPQGEIYKGYENKFEEEYFGALIHRTKIRPRHTGAINLFLNYLSFMFKAKGTVKKLENKFDIVFNFMTSPIFQVSPAIYAKKKYKCPLVMMYLDQWPESLKAGGLNRGPIFWLIKKYCIWALNKCDYILNSSPSFIEYNNVVNKVPKEKMDWSIQYVEDCFKNVNTQKEKKDSTDLIFAGNIGSVQNVEDIIKAYNELKYSDLKIHLFGDGSSFEKCKELVSQMGLNNNIIMYGRVPNDLLVNYYKDMDACLLTLSGKNAIGNTIPAKLPNYMSASKPILAAINGDSRVIIDNAKCGKYTDPDDYKKLAILIDDYYKHKDQYEECGINGRQYYEKECTEDVFINKLLKIFNNLIKVRN